MRCRTQDNKQKSKKNFQFKNGNSKNYPPKNNNNNVDAPRKQSLQASSQLTQEANTNEPESAVISHANFKLGRHQVLSAVAIGNQTTERVSVLFDSESALSLCKESLAQNLGLKPIGSDSLQIEWICSTVPEKSEYNR